MEFRMVKVKEKNHIKVFEFDYNLLCLWNID